MPNGKFIGWNGQYEVEVDNPLRAWDRDSYMHERDANPWKKDGGRLVEYLITATPTGVTGEQMYDENGEWRCPSAPGPEDEWE